MVKSSKTLRGAQAPLVFIGMKSLLMIISVIVFIFVGISWSSTLSDRLWQLDLKYKGFRLGEKLSEEDLRSFEKMSKSHKGVIRYRKDGLILAIAKKDGCLLAIYEEHKFRNSSGFSVWSQKLIREFGEPTVIVHKRIWFWLYGEEGKIEREEYQRLRQQNEEPPVLAMVKLVSRSEKEFYLVIFSPDLIKEYINPIDLAKGR